VLGSSITCASILKTVQAPVNTPAVGFLSCSVAGGCRSVEVRRLFGSAPRKEPLHPTCKVVEYLHIGRRALS